jgi:hypothetical protein
MRFPLKIILLTVKQGMFLSVRKGKENEVQQQWKLPEPENSTQ